jgi:hypothetical protein
MRELISESAFGLRIELERLTRRQKKSSTPFGIRSTAFELSSLWTTS